MKNFFKNNSKKLKKYYIFFVATIFFIGGFWFSTLINQTNKIFTSASAQNTNTFSLPNVLDEVKNILDKNFISWKSSSTLPTLKDFNYGLIKGYVSAYNDPYTEYFTPKESKNFEESIKGSFGGIGAYVSYKDKNIVIQSVIKNTPAEKGGLKSGDVLISVNGTSVLGKSVDEAVNLIRGEIGTNVEVEIFNKDDLKTKKIKLTRALIEIPIIETEIKNNVFVIHFNSFTQDSQIKFKSALQDFINSNKKDLIIDLRGNGGGYLDSAIDIASYFLPKDKIIVVEKNSINKEDLSHYSFGYDLLKDKKYKIIVLTDGGSASASEILAGALKDNGVAKIIGEKTFGKGSVQQLIKLSDGSDLKVTVAKWYTPNGINISETGISPDIWASTTSTTTKDKDGKVLDLQLLETIKILKKIK